MTTKTDSGRGRSSPKHTEHVGGFTLPIVQANVPVDHAAYFGALGVLAALEVIESPRTEFAEQAAISSLSSLGLCLPRCFVGLAQ